MFFYADDGMVASTDPGWPHNIFDTLTLILNWVGLKNNVQKTVGMVCHSCRSVGVRVDEAYNWQITGAGSSYKERYRYRVSFPECSKDLVRGLLAAH